MFKILVDTCVWIDLAKNHRSDALLDVLEQFIRQGDIELIVPSVVVEEFARNKQRIVKEGVQSLAGSIQRVRGAVNLYGNPRDRARLTERLTDLEFKLRSAGDTVVSSVARIERILLSSDVMKLSDTVKARAAERALAATAPFHRNKNAMGDAILLEIYLDTLGSQSKKGTRFAFVTHNKNDFSVPNGDHRTPHPHLVRHFSKIRSLYCTNLVDVLRRIDANHLTEQIDLYEPLDEPRSMSSIVEAMDELVDQIWYNRHQVLRERIESGRVTIVDEESVPRRIGGRETIQRKIWAGAQKAAQRLQKKRGLENLGPWNDFDWGMINGKLSALRWIMGENWDELDT